MSRLGGQSELNSSAQTTFTTAVSLRSVVLEPIVTLARQKYIRRISTCCHANDVLEFGLLSLWRSTTNTGQTCRRVIQDLRADYCTVTTAQHCKSIGGELASVQTPARHVFQDSRIVMADYITLLVSSLTTAAEQCRFESASAKHRMARCRRGLASSIAGPTVRSAMRPRARAVCRREAAG